MHNTVDEILQQATQFMMMIKILDFPHNITSIVDIQTSVGQKLYFIVFVHLHHFASKERREKKISPITAVIQFSLLAFRKNYFRWHSKNFHAHKKNCSMSFFFLLLRLARWNVNYNDEKMFQHILLKNAPII